MSPFLSFIQLLQHDISPTICCPLWEFTCCSISMCRDLHSDNIQASFLFFWEKTLFEIGLSFGVLVTLSSSVCIFLSSWKLLPFMNFFCFPFGDIVIGDFSPFQSFLNFTLLYFSGNVGSRSDRKNWMDVLVLSALLMFQDILKPLMKYTSYFLSRSIFFSEKIHGFFIILILHISFSLFCIGRNFRIRKSIFFGLRSCRFSNFSVCKIFLFF